MKTIITLLVAVCFISCTPKPEMKPAVKVAPTTTTTATATHEPCEVDPTQCFSWEAPEQERNNESVIPTPLNRNNDKPKKLKK